MTLFEHGNILWESRAGWGDAEQHHGPWTAELRVANQDANLQPSMVELVGSAPARRFVLLVKGGRDIAVPRALALTRALKDAAGRWRNFQSTDTNGNVVPIFINPDKSPKQIRTEVQCKHLHKILKDRYPNRNWKAFRARGEIHCDAVKIVRLEINGQADPTKLQWNHKALGSIAEVDREAVGNAFSALYADTEDAEWRS